MGLLLALSGKTADPAAQASAGRSGYQSSDRVEMAEAGTPSICPSLDVIVGVS